MSRRGHLRIPVNIEEDIRMRLMDGIILTVLAAAVPAWAHAAGPAHAAATNDTRSGQAQTLIDRLAGADFRIDVPAHWNHGLVVYFHGYSIDPVTFAVGDALSPMFEPILAQGYAVIQSGYSGTGWAIEEGSADTEKLRRHFVATFGVPKETFVMGMSMGGAMTVMAIETRPDVYDAALSLCGAIEPSDRFMQRDFALRAAFDYYFPDLLGELVPVPTTYVPSTAVERRIGAAFASNPKGYAAIRALYGAGDERDLPGVIAFITYDIKEMQQRTRGNPFGNADLIYTGSADDFALNDGVKRYRSETAASAYVSRWYTPSGKLIRPMLALHDTGDPLVVASSAFEYAILALRAGNAKRFVQQYVNAQGHCVFTPSQIGKAFADLVTWKRTGAAPASGRQR